jgi:hypothetical protein
MEDLAITTGRKTLSTVKREAIAVVLTDCGLPIIAQMVRDDAKYAAKFMRAFEIVDDERARIDTRAKAVMFDADELAAATSDAYSAAAYAPGEWAKCGALLNSLGYTRAQAECILRSKITRWCRDMSDNEYGANTAADLDAYLAKYGTGTLAINA